jgi:hypothetical protein
MSTFTPHHPDWRPNSQDPGTLVLQTNPIPYEGTYFVSASADFNFNFNQNGGSALAACYITTAMTGPTPTFVSAGANSTYNATTLSNTDVVTVNNSGDQIQLWCATTTTGAAGNPPDSFPAWASLTATLINSVNPAAAASPPGPAQPAN